MDDVKALLPDRQNKEFGTFFDNVILSYLIIIVLFLLLALALLYPINHRVLPVYSAVTPEGQQSVLQAQFEPNLLPTTITKWASKVAAQAYTFDYVNYNKQAESLRGYFTESGWNDYINSLSGFIETITANQLIVTGVVSGAPVISTQGQPAGHNYTWRVQIPFLVTYQSSERVKQVDYLVTLTIVRVPTWINPDGIGVDQFVMT